jgi:N4-gp56 family major capsid protein
MANIIVLTGDAQTQKLWAKEVIIEAQKEIFWGKFMGKGPNNVIEVREDFTKSKGDNITYPLWMKPTGAGVTGDAALEGSEESPTKFQDVVTVDQKRHAIRLDGAMTELRPAYDLRSVAKELLKIWLAEKIDSDIFTAFALSPTRVLRPGVATTKATLTAADLFVLGLGSKARVLAAKTSPRLLPVSMGGRYMHLVVLHPDQEYDLKVNDATWGQAQRDARERGDSNPVFTGALGYVDSVLYHSHVNIGTFADGGAGANLTGANALFLARQAMVFAWAKKPFWVEKEFDYANQTGFATGAIWGQKKSVFNAEDFGVVVLQTIRTAITEQAI